MAKKFNAQIYHDIARYSDKEEYKAKGNVVDYEITVNVNWNRLARAVSGGQFPLDTAIMVSMARRMPKQSSVFIDTTKAMSAALAGTGVIVAAAPPMGRMLYFAKTMVDILTGSTYARKGAKKVLVSQFGGKTKAKEDLVFSKAKNPRATPRWFEVSKKEDYGEWVEIVQKAVDKELRNG